LKQGHCLFEPLFLSDYENRVTAARVFARQFNALLEEAGLKMDAVLQTQRTIYSLRHTAICMRIILSQGKVNIFNLAKNAGTSVEQIERFYARNLPSWRRTCRALVRGSSKNFTGEMPNHPQMGA
jgi:hypothetical protein